MSVSLSVSRISSTKILITLAVLLISSWIGWNIYCYLFSITPPIVLVKSLENEKCYAGNFKCIIKGKDDYKVSTMTVMLDDKVIIDNQKINRSSFEYPLDIDTNTLSNGKHKLFIELENSAYNKNRTTHSINFEVDNLPFNAEIVKNSNSKILQGRTLHLMFKANKEILSAKAFAFSKEFNCVRESDKSFIYECFIPIDCEENTGDYSVQIEALDKVNNKLNLDTKFEIVKGAFKRSSMKLNPDKVKEEAEIGIPEKELDLELENLAKKSPAQKLWQGQFITPVNIRDLRQITTDFGTIRSTQERGLNQHKAIDIYDMPKAVIWASADGIVVLKNRYVHTGNTIVIDHGCGVLSLYSHLDSFADINVGDKIRKGRPVGKMGKTGYATGEHLHWALFVNNIAIDPMEWTMENF